MRMKSISLEVFALVREVGHSECACFMTSTNISLTILLQTINKKGSGLKAVLGMKAFVEYHMSVQELESFTQRGCSSIFENDDDE